MSLCPVPDCMEHYGCRIRKHGGLQIAPSATPSQHNRVAPPEANPVWENTSCGSFRPDGSFMPLLSSDLSRVIKVKEFGENRRNYESQLHRLRQGGTEP